VTSATGPPGQPRSGPGRARGRGDARVADGVGLLAGQRPVRARAGSARRPATGSPPAPGARCRRRRAAASSSSSPAPRAARRRPRPPGRRPDDQRQVEEHRREGRDRRPDRHRGRRQRVDVQLHDRRAGRQLQRRAHPGCSSPACRRPARRPAARRSGPGARAPAPARARSARPRRGRDRRRPRRRRPSRRPARPHQPRGSRLPASATATCHGCSGTAPSRAARVSVVRPAVDARQRRRRAHPAGKTAPCSKSATSRLPPGEVAGQRRQQPRQQRCAQPRLLLRQRIADDEQPCCAVVVGQAERVQRRRCPMNG
jgi:hypothetical protein